MSKATVSRILHFMMITTGILSACFGLKGFLLPNHFIDGGVTGISMLVSEVTGMPLALLILIINAPFIIMGYYLINPGFALRSMLALIGLALCVYYLDFPVITNDKLLACVFGGLFLGAGIGLSIRGGSVLDGTEIMGLLLSRKLHVTIGDIILIVNVCIFAVAAKFLGIESAMYSILTYLSASKTIDFLIHGIEEYIGVTIISNEHDRIKQSVLNDLGRGATIYKGKRGFTDEDQDILFCVVTRLELPKLRSIINEIDDDAFILTSTINDIKGGMIKKRVFH